MDKEKPNALEKYYKILMILFSTGILGLIFKFAVDFKSAQETNKAVHFDSPKHKVEIDTKVKALPSPREIVSKRLRDSANTVSAIKSRALRDSLTKVQNSRDSLTAVTIYQMKEEIRELKNNR